MAQDPSIQQWLQWRPESGTPAPMQWGAVRSALQGLPRAPGGGPNPRNPLLLDFLRFQGTSKYPTDPFATDAQLRPSAMSLNTTRSGLVSNEQNPQWLRNYWSGRSDQDFANIQSKLREAAVGSGVRITPEGVKTAHSGVGDNRTFITPQGETISYKGATPYSKFPVV